jgi:Tol biopolymer transport system component
VSPDGKWIVFFANQQRSGMQCDENNLYVTNSTGTFLQNVQASVCPNATDFHDISWNEDNLKHAFPCNEDAQERSGICLITISEDKIDLTHVAKNAGMFTTSPDHKSLVYSQTDDGQICLFTAVYDTAQSQKRYCGAKALLFLSWLSDNQSIVGIAADKMMRSENGDLLLFDFKTTEPKVLLSFTGTDDSYLTLSPDRSQIVFCASQPIGTPSVLYMYDLNVDQAYKIENTSLIYTDDTTCNNGWFTFTDQNTLLFQTDYNRDKVHSYKLDFINGSISE